MWFQVGWKALWEERIAALYKCFFWFIRGLKGKASWWLCWRYKLVIANKVIENLACQDRTFKLFWCFFSGVGNPGVGGGPPGSVPTPLNSIRKVWTFKSLGFGWVSITTIYLPCFVSVIEQVSFALRRLSALMCGPTGQIKRSPRAAKLHLDLEW